MMKKNFVLFGALAFVFIQCQPKAQPELSKNEMFQIVRELDNKFGIGVGKKDSAFITDIYSDSAQYVQPNREILVGKTEIAKDWGGFLRLKENPMNIIFNIHDVSGNREILYETGTGYTLLADSTRWNFNYVNVWRLHKDGSYKLEVDTYTPMD